MWESTAEPHTCSRGFAILDSETQDLNTYLTYVIVRPAILYSRIAGVC